LNIKARSEKLEEKIEKGRRGGEEQLEP